jgi:chromosome segregation ATPase
MEINNPVDIAVPEELQKKVEQVRNNLTIAEQELQRLNELKYSQESEIKDNLTKLDRVNSEIEIKEKVLATLNDKIRKGNEELSAISMDYGNTKKDFWFVQDARNRTLEEIENEKAELEKLRVSAYQLKEHADSRVAIVEERERIVSEKEDRLKKLAEIL